MLAGMRIAPNNQSLGNISMHIELKTPFSYFL